MTLISTRNLFLAAALCIAAGTANGADDTVNFVRNSEKYLVGRGPTLTAEQLRQALEAQAPQRALEAAATTSSGTCAGSGPTRETAAAVIQGNFTVIPNATAGLNGNTSYIRFPNFNPDLTTNATVRMVGDSTGRDYGTAIVTSAPNSSPQLTVLELLESIEGGTFDATDTSITLYIQSNQFLTGVQHVYYSNVSGFFENMSVCSFVDGVSYLPTMAGVVNVHTTTLNPFYPSVVKVHNKNPTATTLTLRVHDGPTGVLRGRFSFVAQPNSTYAFTPAQIQANVGWIATSDDYHMNVIFDTEPATPPNAIISHTVSNPTYGGAVLNLTTICNIND